ncbi:MAG TPA: CARDB domain-containing protein, partial [Rhizomicrobium sp.]|nr:CARDB domain-containing protein [Rhizomicrobium sp.]
MAVPGLLKPVDALDTAITNGVDDIVSTGDDSDAFNFGAAFPVANQANTGTDALTLSSTVDLTATSASLSGSTFSYHINNVGSSAAASSTAGIYLSTDSTITTSDTRINTHATPSLAAGASDIESVVLTLPTTLTPGTYYIGAIADYTNTIAESDETNNASSAIPIILGNDSANTLNSTTGSDNIFALGG